MSKFVFTGRLAPAELGRLLASGDLHIYLTVPFVLSWSMMDALSCGATVLASRGAHRDAAVEFGWLARNDPRQVAWALAEAAERLDAAQEARGIEAARRAARLEPDNVSAQLALARGLTRLGDARGALAAAQRAVSLAPDEAGSREALADALWLTGREAAAFTEFLALLERMAGRDRRRVLAKARSLYRQQAGPLGRALASVEPLFRLALRFDWISVA